MRYVIRYSIAAVLVLLLNGSVALAETVPVQEDLKQTIDYLLDSVARSDASFIRNGQTYTPKEAAAHMKTKYDYFKWMIKTPEDFIRLAGSRSLLSGRPYLVKTKDGKEIEAADWLGKVLSDYRAARKDSQREKR